MLFLDSADVTRSQPWLDMAVVRGVTTNATLMRKAGVMPVQLVVKRLLDLDPGELHVQVLSEDEETAYGEALALADLDNRVRIKVPFVTSGGRYRTALIRRLQSSGVAVNVTACTSRAQAYAALALCPSYISLLWCRTRDAGESPAEVTAALARRRDRDAPDCRVLIGSIREGADVTAALDSCADIVTVPPAVLEDWLHSPASVAMAGQFAADAAELTL
ncbi:transaldolase family protein [Streptomyces sp. NPDC056161]|uniref:transaldolase family protein n=1 Tax=Streptomyces sp. NPDC056161 TaxID=3345732 RepID=UPI0035DCFDD0